MYKVYHSKDFRRTSAYGIAELISNEEILEGYRDGSLYEHVADVLPEVGGLEAVYRLTNTIHKPWLFNDNVHARINKARSTSVGDLIVEEGGAVYVVASFGFDKIYSPTEMLLNVGES